MHAKICNIDCAGTNFLRSFSNKSNHMAKLLLTIFMFFSSSSIFSYCKLIEVVMFTNNPQALYNFAMAEVSLCKKVKLLSLDVCITDK